MNFKKSQKHCRRFERKHNTKQISVLEYRKNESNFFMKKLRSVYYMKMR